VNEQQPISEETAALDELAFNVENYKGGLKSVLESILITVSEPQSPEILAKALAVNLSEVTSTLEALSLEYKEQNRGFELREFDGLWRYYSDPEFGDLISKYINKSAEAKLSVPALETLAIIAYRQPVNRGQVAAIRGVNVDGVFRTLLSRGFIAEARTSKEDSENPGPTKYITTALFLEKLGLSSLTELEPLAPYLPNDIGDIPEFEDIRKRNSHNNNTEEVLDDDE
jgi:segregation and condensation protein B